MKRRITTFLLAVCMTVSLLAVPAGAASGATVTFSDIGDRSTAMAVESLRLLGVLDGYGDGTFRPATVLTRAQFCKMAVYAMNGSSELSRYRTVTIFPDVKPSHWAAAYINMAAKGKNIISGYADGKFHPDRTVTVGQAVTILLRMLGWSDADGDFVISGAAAFAQRIGLFPISYTGTMSQGGLAETALAALSFSYRDSGDTVIGRLADKGRISRSAANALGLLTPALTARQVTDRCSAAVFRLDTYETEELWEAGVTSGDASGFFITEDGLAVTNYHSIEGAVRAAAVLSTGERYEVESVIWYDTGIDIAVIRVSREALKGADTTAFAVLDIAPSGTGDLRAGDTVYAIGNPLGLGLAVSSGIVSATQRDVERYALPCVMSTADISEGSSGGALLNMDGELVGINSAKVSSEEVEGMGYAIPADQVWSVISAMIPPSAFADSAVI